MKILGRLALAALFSFNLVASVSANSFSSPNKIEHKFSVAPYVKKADIDQDGDMDLLAFKPYTSFPIAWLEVKGDGKFTHHDIDPEITYVHDMAAGDVDGDGDVDLLAYGNAAGIVYYENLKGGKAFARHDVSDPGRVLSLAIADVDGDKDGDIVFLDYDQVAFLRNEDGKGTTWSDPVKIATGGGEGQTRGIGVADMDKDGDHDLVTFLYGKLSVLTNKKGNFDVKSVATTGGMFSLNDMDKDGYPDILVTEGSDIVMIENIGGKGYSAQDVFTSNMSTMENVDAGDVDGNGLSDIVAKLQGKVVIFANQGDGKWKQELLYNEPDGSKECLYVLDMDGDKKSDVVSIPRVDGKTFWLKNSGK